MVFLAASTRLGLALEISGRELVEDAALLEAIATDPTLQLAPLVYVYKMLPWKIVGSRDKNGRRYVSM